MYRYCECEGTRDHFQSWSLEIIHSITSLAFVPLVEIFEGIMPLRLPLFSVAAICGHAVLHAPGAAAAGLGVLRRGLQLRQDHAGEL